MSEPDQDKLFAQIALAKGYLSSQKVAQSLQIKKNKPQLSLVQICLEHEWVSPEQMQSIYTQIQERLEETKRKSPMVKHKETQLPGATKPEVQQMAIDTSPLQASPLGNKSDFGNYVLLHEIARGGMGIVFKARQKDRDRVVALKVMRQLDAFDKSQVARFQREFSAASKLSHPNIVAMYDAGRVRDTYYFTMEFIEGETLSHTFQGRKLSTKFVIQVMEKIARAVHYAHTQNIIHRDLKPANILMDKDLEPHITDFGLAKDLSRNTQLTTTGTALGTPYYMPPEQIEAKSQELGPGTDIYALGVILYELLAGSLPFSGTSLGALYAQILSGEFKKPSKLNPTIPTPLENVVLKAMAKDIRQRYSDAKALADDLKKFQKGKKTSARGLSLLQKMLAIKNLPLRGSLAIVSLLTLVLLFLGLWVRSSVPDDTKIEKIQEQFRKLQDLFSQKQWGLVQQKAGEILSEHPNHDGTIPCYALLGQSRENSGDLEGALSAYQTLYVYASAPPLQLTALKGMVRCVFQQKQYKKALQILATLQQRFPDKDLLDIHWVYAQVLFHTGNFTEAKTSLNKVAPKDLALQDQKQYLFYRRWLEMFTSVVRFPCSATNFTLVDIDGDGRREIVLMSKNTLTIYTLEHGKLKELYYLKCPDSGEFMDVQAGNFIGGPQEKELIATASIQNQTHIVLFKKKKNFVPIFSAPVHAALGQMWVGNPLPDKKAVIILALGQGGRNAQIFFYDKKTIEKVDLDPKISSSNTDVLAVDVGDIDVDGMPEVVLGTGPWTLYDLRAYTYNPATGEFSEKAHKRLGAVCGCKIVDMDRDGRPEILAVKRYTVNSEVFGNVSPYGAPDGLYVFQCVSGNFKEVWRHTFPASKNPQRSFGELCSGYMKNLGQIAALRYTATETKQVENTEKTETTEEIWFICLQNGKYQCVPIIPQGIVRFHIGDVGGDLHAEFLVLTKDELLIYGLNPH
jgi:serine/threonine protein kinase